jgi:hypothetical protein
MSRHKFAVGERVELVPSPGDVRVPRGPYTVERLLPDEHNDREYRVRCVKDGHERVAHEAQLRSVSHLPLQK